MAYKVDAVKIKEYFNHVSSEGNAFIPRGATNFRIFNFKKIRGTVNYVYSFSLVYSYENKDAKLDLVLKLYDNTEQYRKICQKEYHVIKNLS